MKRSQPRRSLLSPPTEIGIVKGGTDKREDDIKNFETRVQISSQKNIPPPISSFDPNLGKSLITWKSYKHDDSFVVTMFKPSCAEPKQASPEEKNLEEETADAWYCLPFTKIFKLCSFFSPCHRREK